MAFLNRVAGPPLILALVLTSLAAAADPAADFDNAARFDLEGKPQLAYAAYLKAAHAGLPDAEFNVAVMLDSGRGVEPDPAGAATWYARAASHGLSRAAYDLGQLYESGQGVPRNIDLARAWFEAAHLPASRDHLTAFKRRAIENDTRLTAPKLIAPVADEALEGKNGVELVWTSGLANEPAQFFVELRSERKLGSIEIQTKLSSFFVENLESGTAYAWRVTTIEKNSGQYIKSSWYHFRYN